MESGALGLSTGLEYDPSIYSDTSEIIQVARVVGAMGGKYISHMRSEDRYFWAAIDELLNIGEKANIDVQISHIKLAMQGYFGLADSVVGILNDARERGINVTADIYPYTYWQSDLTVLMPSRDFKNREEATAALTDITTPEGVLITYYPLNKALENKTLKEIADEREQDPIDVFMDLLVEISAHTDSTDEWSSIIAESMDESDIENFMKWNYTSFCSDGSLNGTHPRGYGSFTRILGNYVRDRGVMSLENVIPKMTSLAAENVGFKNRGVIKKGMYADIILFDPENVIDLATVENPNEKSKGIELVIVNGKVVYRDGKSTGVYPGKALLRE